MIHGIEVTAQVQARRQAEAVLEELQQKERQQQFLIELNDTVRALQDSHEIMWHVVSATGQHFDVTRCTYGEIDATQEYVIVDRDYCNGVISVAGSHQMDSFGPTLIAELKLGKTIVVDDVDRDPRTAGAGAAAFDAIQTKSLLCVPLVKEGRFVALFVLHHVTPRQWTRDDVELMERIATKTWLAVERSRAEAELRESEAHLQLALKVGRMGTWDWNMQMNTITWSDGQFSIMGLQASEYPLAMNSGPGVCIQTIYRQQKQPFNKRCRSEPSFTMSIEPSGQMALCIGQKREDDLPITQSNSQCA